MDNDYNVSNTDVIVVTSNYVPGYKINRIIGLTWGLIVRSRGVGGNISASLKSIVGGEINAYTRLLNESRMQAVERLIEHAKSLGANGVIDTRFDSSEIGGVMNEVLAYGTAVVIVPEGKESQPVSLR
ncbi:MAG: heavy metal-binding domain-containing protein [Thermoplasmata archaeon]